MTGRVLHQVSIGATIGDAITDQAFVLRRWLREAGFDSELYAEHIHPALQAEVRPVAHYRPRPGEQALIYHHSIGSPVAEQLIQSRVRLILIYHNVTPPEFFASVNPVLAQEMVEGRRQLQSLLPHTQLALGVSAYNAEELRAAGFDQVGVLPLTLDERRYRLPHNETLLAQWADTGPRLLFVGRLVPQKKQEDLIKLLYYYRRIEPQAQLLLVGDPWLPDYAHWLRELVADLKLQDAVHVIGHASQADLVTYYALADLYVSMSEHEGFGKPLIESMYHDLPVLAYAAAGIPGTLGDAGVLFCRKDYEALAEVVDLLCRDRVLRARVIARQRERLQAFLEPEVRRTWETLLVDLGLTH